MKKVCSGWTWLGTATACLGFGAFAALAAQPAVPRPAEQRAPDLTILHVQVLLDHLGFGPGVIDGRDGWSLTAALRGFQESRGLAGTGKIDAATLQALHRYRAIRPLRMVTLAATDIAGPYVGRLPDDYALQAKLPSLGYANALERLSERFHTAPGTLAALNPGGRIAVGTALRVPNMQPASTDYDATLRADWRQTLADLGVSAKQPRGDLIIVDKSEGVLKVMAGDKLVAQFPATLGSRRDPLPLGSWKILGASYNPPFHYNPDLFWDADSQDEKQKLPPGPNGPVGVVWLDLSKKHYGIHGTPKPETIGRAESHGCIRLTNWDAARLALMVRPGTPARFQA